MPDQKYLIIGGGMTADAAVKGIRKVHSGGQIGLITLEQHLPYGRPPLSKALWKGEAVETIWRKTPVENVSVYLHTTATDIDLQNKKVRDASGIWYGFEKLLLATGGVVRRLPFKAEGIIYYRTLDDYLQLRTLTGRGKTFVVIGGGFIGSEIAAAIAMNHKKVTMIFPEEGIGARVYPRALSLFLNSFYTSKGVEVLANDGVTSVEKRNAHYIVRTSGGRELAADAVIAGVGIQPNVDLARQAGLTVDNGIQVDEYLRTSHPDVFAAGDVANFYNPALGKRIRVEHEDNATTMGDMAGQNMAGGSLPYRHLPFFYSDLFDLGYEAVGELDSRTENVEDWKEPFREGVIYYLGDHRVRGVLLWNTWGQVDAARSLIGEKGPFDAGNVKGRLPA
ncbi:MAG TPA: FAD-dependent oxidoreductase [Bacteroidota bacterium]|jgi:NADPH-dependent 2,4-dienoyl-CoA reductase/sulfur reductase-like enzyme|nr:FAD-dependent oxidoreductase [Bacteroidota bacterium]